MQAWAWRMSKGQDSLKLSQGGTGERCSLMKKCFSCWTIFRNTGKEKSLSCLRAFLDSWFFFLSPWWDLWLQCSPWQSLELEKNSTLSCWQRKGRKKKSFFIHFLYDEWRWLKIILQIFTVLIFYIRNAFEIYAYFLKGCWNDWKPNIKKSM